MKRQSKIWILPAFIFGGSLLLAGGSVLFLLGGIAMSAGGNSFGESIALIHVSGVITGEGDGGGPFGESMAGSERIINQLEQARKDKNVKAVVIRINSPGGSAAASQEIYQEVRKVSRKKRVIASMGDVAASGGYYVASATDRIIANPATMTGSIGVIMELQNMEALFRKIGLDPETVKSGPHKDMGSPSRPLTSDERQILQNMINQVYSQFLKDVTRGRKKLTLQQVKVLADGRIYTGEEAQRVGLVDELGGLKTAIHLAAREGGIKGEPEVVSYDTSSFVDLLMNGLSKGLRGFMTRSISDALQSTFAQSPKILSVH